MAGKRRRKGKSSKRSNACSSQSLVTPSVTAVDNMSLLCTSPHSNGDPCLEASKSPKEGKNPPESSTSEASSARPDIIEKRSEASIEKENDEAISASASADVKPSTEEQTKELPNGQQLTDGPTAALLSIPADIKPPDEDEGKEVTASPSSPVDLIPPEEESKELTDGQAASPSTLVDLETPKEQSNELINGQVSATTLVDSNLPEEQTKEVADVQSTPAAVPVWNFIADPGHQKMSGDYMSEDSALPPSPPFEGETDIMEPGKLEETDVEASKMEPGKLDETDGEAGKMELGKLEETYDGAGKMEPDKLDVTDVPVPSPPSSESGIGAMACGDQSEVDEEESDMTPSRKRTSTPYVEEDDYEYSDSPKRRLRSANSPSLSKKWKSTAYDEQDYDTIRLSVLKQSSAMRRKSSKKSTAEKGLEKCPLCRQVLVSKHLALFKGPPDDALTEKEALEKPDLKILGEGEVPLNRVVLFSIYDENKHLCPLDDGSVERGVKLHMSGYIKPIFDEDRTSASGGTPAKDIGPITEWWIGGYEEPEPYIGLSTDQGEYILGAPSPYYLPYLEPIFEKVFLGKLVIGFLNKQEGAAYEDLLTYVETQERPPGIPPITEDSLMRHAQFICDQVVSFDEAGFSDDESGDDEDWRKLITEPCMRSLIEFAGATVTRRKDKSVLSKSSIFRLKHSKRRSKKVETGLETWTKATTTPLVCAVFDSIFADQIDNKTNTRDKELDEQECKDDSDSEVDVESNSLGRKRLSISNYKKVCAKRIEWTSKPVHISRKETYYSSALVGDVEVSVGDFVSFSGDDSSFIGNVQYMWEDAKREKCAHMLWFMYGKETMLGENADPHEIYMGDRCEDVWLSRIMSHVDVKKKVYSKNWHNEGGLEPSQNNNPSTYFYSKIYDESRCRFEDVPESTPSENNFRHCINCETNLLMEFEAPITSEPLPKVTSNGNIEYASVSWRGETYSRGQSVYLDSETFDFEPVNVSWLDIKYDPDPVNFSNENLYPERYRKKLDTGRGSNEYTPDPFCIGLISSISATCKGVCPASDITLKVYKYYRPENTRNVVNKGDIAQMDITMLFASEEEVEIDFSRVRGICYVVYKNNLNGEDPGKWSMAGPDRFYFQESYDAFDEELKEPLEIFTLLGKVRNDSPECDQRGHLTVPEYPQITRKLKCLDLFAGCGGLSEGLHQSGVAESKWGVEKVSAAAQAFKLNNPQAEVFTMDVNDLLRDVLQGETRNKEQQFYPQKGEVDMIVGGPPCQGFSGLNRFTMNDYSLFKNSLIVSMISYCDYYRPKYFLMENVRNLVSFAQGTVLQLIFSALLKMGYQVTVGVLQAGHYGVPQTRRRTIILAAAPGEILPQYPEPRHVFNPYSCFLAITCGDKKFDPGLEYTNCAPYRTITVYDAMSDLPEIKSGFSKEEIPYEKEPETHFQRQVREGNAILRDHICKELALIVQTRIDFIPKIRNADWRDLPNFEADCGNGQKCNILLYTHHDRKYGKSKTGALRGVCSCAMGGSCEPTDKQYATLIPWSLPHSAQRNSNWIGLYGRIQWDEYFITTVTNPEPMGKQGKVLHPTQNRVVSVRECARSQGFDDKFRFYGDVLEKHRQVGNAVPPPMGKAVGLEILKSIAQKENTYVPPFMRIRDVVGKNADGAVKQEDVGYSDSSESDDDAEGLDAIIERKVERIIREDTQDDEEEAPIRRCYWRQCKAEPKVEPYTHFKPPRDSKPPLDVPGMPELFLEMPKIENFGESQPKLSGEIPDPLLDVPDMPILSPQIDVPSVSNTPEEDPVIVKTSEEPETPIQIDSDSDADDVVMVN